MANDGTIWEYVSRFRDWHEQRQYHDYIASFVVLIGMMAFYRITPTWAVLTLPLFLVLAGATALGVGLWLAGLAVKFHDVATGLGFAVDVWKYLTPVAYPATLIPEQWQTLYYLNPMTAVVEGFRWALLGTGQPPDWTLLVSTLIVLPIFIGGLYYFKRVERNIVDIA